MAMSQSRAVLSSLVESSRLPSGSARTHSPIILRVTDEASCFDIGLGGGRGTPMSEAACPFGDRCGRETPAGRELLQSRIWLNQQLPFRF